MKKILFLLLIVANVITAQNASDSFTSANNLYKTEKFEEAIQLYQKIETEGFISSELYYNLGNSYYKLNKVGPSIYYYEKSLKLDPLNEDVKNNLVFARRLALDNIEELPNTIFQKFNKNYLQKLSYNQWAIIVIIFSVLGSLLFLIFYFATTPSKKRFYFAASSSSLILLAFSLLITYNQYLASKNNKEAIIFVAKTEVRNAPTLNSEEVFTLEE
jgi:tetratricopeptide (TPR) repeat protein